MAPAPRLVGIVQAPDLSRLFGCTPVSQVSRIIAGTASAAATAGLLLGGVVPLALPAMAAPSTAVHPDVAEPSAEPLLAATAGLTWQPWKS